MGKFARFFSRLFLQLSIATRGERMPFSLLKRESVPSTLRICPLILYSNKYSRWYSVLDFAISCIISFLFLLFSRPARVFSLLPLRNTSFKTSNAGCGYLWLSSICVLCVSSEILSMEAPPKTQLKKLAVTIHESHIIECDDWRILLYDFLPPTSRYRTMID